MNNKEFNIAFRELVEDAKTNQNESARKEYYVNRHKDTKLVGLVARMADVQEIDKYLENLGKYLHAELDVLRLQLIPEAIEKGGLRSPVNVAGVGKVVLSGDMYTKVMDEEGLYKWLRKMKMGSYIIKTVNSSTLKAGLKLRLTSGKSLPPETVVKVTPFTRASITGKDKAKEES